MNKPKLTLAATLALALALTLSCSSDGGDNENSLSSSSEGQQGDSSSSIQQGDGSSSSQQQGGSSSSSEQGGNSSSSTANSSSSSDTSNEGKLQCGAAFYDPSTHFCKSGTTVTAYPTFTDDRDGKTYKYVPIGNQVWMAENLNYDESGSRCYDDANGRDSRGNCAMYGRLYKWETAMGFAAACNNQLIAGCGESIGEQHQGVCPDGWHIPSNDELAVLMDYIGGLSTAGTKLKASSGWDGDGNGLDAYGFSALPSGFGRNNGTFDLIGSNSAWWIASEVDYSSAKTLGMSSINENASNGSNTKNYLYGIRCVKSKVVIDGDVVIWGHNSFVETSGWENMEEYWEWYASGGLESFNVSAITSEGLEITGNGFGYRFIIVPKSLGELSKINDIDGINVITTSFDMADFTIDTVPYYIYKGQMNNSDYNLRLRLVY